MKLFLALFLGVSMCSFSANASQSFRSEMRIQYEQLLALSQGADRAIADYRPNSADSACYRIGELGSFTTVFLVASEGEGITDANRALANLASDIYTLAGDLSGFCGESGSVPRGAQQEAASKMTEIKSKISSIPNLIDNL